MSEEHKLVREFPVEITESGDGRTLDVRIVPYNKPTQVADKPSNGGTGEPYMEEWLPGVFDGQMSAANRIDVLVNFEHERGIAGVVGRGTALWSTNDGAYGSFRMLNTQSADIALELVNEGVATGVSLEALPLKGGTRVENGVVKRAKARLVNIALCRMQAFPEAAVLAVRESPPDDEPEPDDPAPAPEPSEPSEADQALQRVGFEPLVVRAVVRKMWSGDAARFDDDQYRRSCLIDRDGDAPVKERCSLPVLEPNGDVNVNALGAAAAVLSGARGGLKGVSASDRARAARKLMRYYGQAEMEPPASLRRVAAS